MSNPIPAGNYLQQPKFMWFLLLSFTMVITLANWFDARLVHIFRVNTDAGTLIFPITFLLSDLITEVYGYKNARRAIWIGALFNAIFIMYGQLVIHLPSPEYQTHNEMFDTILTIDSRVILASFISYFISEPLNSYTLAKLKLKMCGRCLSMRFVLSTMIASGVDSAVFGMGAFYGMMSGSNLLHLIFVMWLIKVSIEILGLPLSTKLARVLKRTEKIDIYDVGTKFTLFSLDGVYASNKNLYGRPLFDSDFTSDL